MPHMTKISLFIYALPLVLASCGDVSHHASQLMGYGERLPGETWVAVDDTYQSPSLHMVYFDPTTIHRDGDLVTLWQLTDYKGLQGNAPFGSFMMSSHRFSSTKTHKEFDCAHNTVRLLASAEFSQHMGTGTRHAVLVNPDYRQSVESGSINHALWEVACGFTQSACLSPALQ